MNAPDLLETKDALIRFIREEYAPRTPGSASRAGMLYQEIPFEGYEEVGIQRQGSARRLEALLSRVEVSGKRVLDIGCNIGFFCFSLARQGAECWGLDTDPDALRIARSLKGIHRVNGVQFRSGKLCPETLDALLAEAEHFDLILLNSVMHWLLQDTGSIRTVQSWLNRIPARGPQWIVYEPASSRRAPYPEELKPERVRRFFRGIGAGRVERIAREYVTNAGTHRETWLGERDPGGRIRELDGALGDELDPRALTELGATIVHRKRDKIGLRFGETFVKTVVRRGSPYNRFLGNEAGTARLLTAHPRFAPHLLADREFHDRQYLVYEDLDAVPLARSQTPSEAQWIERELRAAGETLASLGIVHNDLRRENVMLDRVRREIRLIDFEFSRRGVPAGAPETGRPFEPGTPEETAMLEEVLPILRAGGPGRGTGTLEGDRQALLEILRDLRVHRRPAWQIALRRALGRR